MKSILITCVLYNDLDSLKKFLDSVSKSFKLIENRMRLTVLIVNNGNDETSEIVSDENIEIINHKCKKNLGYLNGVNSAVRQEDIILNKYDYFIISNVDLTLSLDFFKEIKSLTLKKDIGWIAPQIFSLQENKDRNPKILKRPSKFKILLLVYMYKIPIIYYLYNSFVYGFSRKIKLAQEHKLIYAGHGSFMIFTPTFFKNFPDIAYESFLFGEEIFIAELCLSKNIKVQYYPKIKIIDTDHSSTSKIKRKTFFKMNYQSLKYIKSNFF